MMLVTKIYICTFKFCRATLKLQFEREGKNLLTDVDPIILSNC